MGARSLAPGIALLALLMLWNAPVDAARVKDLADFQGVRNNPLLGYGLIVGLQGTGDSARSLFANRSLAGLLAKLGAAAPGPGGMMWGAQAPSAARRSTANNVPSRRPSCPPVAGRRSEGIAPAIAA